MLALALTLSAAALPAGQARVLIDAPQARLTLLTVDQALSAGPAAKGTAEVMVVLEGEVSLRAGGSSQRVRAGDALFSAASPAWELTPERKGAMGAPPLRILALEAPRAERTWGAAVEGAGAPAAGPPLVRPLRDAAVYPILGGKGAAAIVFDREVAGSAGASHQRLWLAPGAAVPEHEHAGEVEILYVLSGETELTLGGKTRVLKPGDSALIPAAARHSARAVSAGLVQAIQFYLPGGPEQRFKAASPAPGAGSPEIIQHLLQGGKRPAERGRDGGVR